MIDVSFIFRKRNFVISCLLEELFKQEPRLMSELKPVLTGKQQPSRIFKCICVRIERKTFKNMFSPTSTKSFSLVFIIWGWVNLIPSEFSKRGGIFVENLFSCTKVFIRSNRGTTILLVILATFYSFKLVPVGDYIFMFPKYVLVV